MPLNRTQPGLWFSYSELLLIAEFYYFLLVFSPLSLKLLLKCLDACCWFLHLWIVILLLLFAALRLFPLLVRTQPSCVTVEQSCSVCKCRDIRSCRNVLIFLSFFAFLSYRCMEHIERRKKRQHILELIVKNLWEWNMTVGQNTMITPF